MVPYVGCRHGRLQTDPWARKHATKTVKWTVKSSGTLKIFTVWPFMECLQISKLDGCGILEPQMTWLKTFLRVNFIF